LEVGVANAADRDRDRVPPEWPLYIVEFKAGRTDLFFRAADRMVSARGLLFFFFFFS
jgi:hypothetical protein